MSLPIVRPHPAPNPAHDSTVARRMKSWWPDRQCWRTTAVWGGGVSLLWLLVYGGADWITSLHSHRVMLRTVLDSTIPFMSAAAILYLSLMPMLWLAPFTLRTPAQLRAFASSLAILIVISGMGFLLVPAEAIDEISIESHDFGPLFQLADSINLTHNYFPSLHVGMSVVCAVCYGSAASRKASIVYWLWAAAITMAAVATWQHYVVDAIAGGLLGALVARRLT
jgi:membrane-associated phospholipid phosphatase